MATMYKVAVPNGVDDQTRALLESRQVHAMAFREQRWYVGDAFERPAGMAASKIPELVADGVLAEVG